MIRSTLPLFAFALAASAPALAQPIAVPHFDSVQLFAGGDVELVRGPVQRVTLVNGSTDFTSFRVDRNRQLRIQTSCENRCPRNYNLRIRIESPEVPSLAVTAGGSITAQRGFAPQRQISAAVKAGGTIDLRAVDVQDASAAVNAGGDIFVRARSSLSAAVNAGGDIHYAGNPRVTMAINGGGDVRRVN